MYSAFKTPLAHAYFRFLQLTRAVEALPDGHTVDANELALLQAVVLRWHEGQTMTVREAINLADLGSPATLHKRVTRLREKDLLSTVTDASDRRAKYLIPTQKALDYYHRMGHSMLQVHQALDAT